jgi:two-component system cell cycle response regulator DivK
VKAKILVIEDNEQNMYLLTFILEKHDYQVIQAVNGSEGIAQACRHRPDLILLDIQLPTMDGYTVARELRKISELAETPVIAVTSYVMSSDREHALQAGCTGYIEKPINPDTFLTQIEEYLKSD